MAKRVLIVEDQLEIRELIRVTLEFERYELAEAADGAQALEQVGAFKPDLVLLDVVMPGELDGLAVCEAIKSNPATRRTKVVMLTSRTQSADKQEARKVGADAYLVKPFSPMELLGKVKQVI